MSERESTKLRELKEAAYALYQKGRYAECAETYSQLAKLLPRDPNVRVRLAEACRRAGQRTQAIAAYREAAEVLLSLGCESRARGALKVALELDPRDPVLQREVGRLGQGLACSTALEDEQLYSPANDAFVRQPLTTAPPPPPPAFVPGAAQEITRVVAVPTVPTLTPVSVSGARSAAPVRTPGMGSGPGREAVLPHPRPASANTSPVPRIPPLVAPVPSPAANATQANTAPGPGLPKVLPVLPTLTSSKAPGTPAVSKPGATATCPPVKVVTLLNRAQEAAAPKPAPPAPPHAQAGNPHASSLTMPPRATLPFQPEMRRLAPNVMALRVSPQARWVIIRSDSALQVSRAEVLPVEAPAAS